MSSRSVQISRPGSRWLVTIAAFALASLLGLPIVVLVLRAIGEGSLAESIVNPAVRDALGLSLITSTASLAITVLLGTPLAWILARHRPVGARFLEAIVDLPIVLPPSVAGLALLLLLGRRAPLGEPLAALGIAFPYSTLGVVLAQTFVAAPFYIRAARTGFGDVDRRLEEAGRITGASAWQVARAITLPLAAPSLVAGIVMTWSRAVGEFGATILFAGSIAGLTRTLPLLVYGEFQAGDLSASIAAGSILVIAAFGVLLAVRSLRRERWLEGVR